MDSILLQASNIQHETVPYLSVILKRLKDFQNPEDQMDMGKLSLQSSHSEVAAFKRIAQGKISQELLCHHCIETNFL